MAKILDITGMKYAKLTALRIMVAQKPVKWLWLCECGKTTIAQASNVKSGNTNSCGCGQDAARRKKRKFAKGGHFSHQMSRTPIYKAWSSMKGRCLNQKHKSFHNYGGRGIGIDARWAESFESFYVDMGPRPSKQHSLDRIDNNQGYGPDNCRWAIPIVQRNNSRQNRYLTLNGESRTVAQWCRVYGIAQNTVSDRLTRGWTTVDALTKPANKAFASKSAG